jgi:hypothetical protein
MNMEPQFTLSIRQPWAWLIIRPDLTNEADRANACLKNFENRTWPTRFRGTFFVHASQGCTKQEWHDCRWFVHKFNPALAVKIPPIQMLERGGIIGQALLLNCMIKHPSHWFCGPYGFQLTDSKPLPFRPCHGALGFFKV